MPFIFKRNECLLVTMWVLRFVTQFAALSNSITFRAKSTKRCGALFEMLYLTKTVCCDFDGNVSFVLIVLVGLLKYKFNSFVWFLNILLFVYIVLISAWKCYFDRPRPNLPICLIDRQSNACKYFLIRKISRIQTAPKISNFDLWNTQRSVFYQ